ncbi:MAG: hypothetical protein Q4A74_02740 [Cardiobacteriaceae bacterium]|nr:hypothetical protein [Cardiobacteriaceae bacterium]
MFQKIALMFSFLLLAACASNISEDFNLVAGKVMQLAPDKQKVFIATVPASPNMLSDAMAVGMISSGVTRSNSVENILKMLPVENVSIGISGASEAINVATLKRALRDYEGKSNAQIYINASSKDISELQSIASPKGITVNALTL